MGRRRATWPGIALIALATDARAAPDPAITRDRDRVVDLDESCAAAHARGPSAACPRFVRVTASALELLVPIAFPPEKDRPLPASRPILDELVAVLTARPALRLEIVGHGLYEPGRARELGRARAQAVMAYLIAYGVAPARLVARGHRESLPPSGDPRAPHLRRIELRVLP